jgi:hypothetical protein
MRKKSNIFNLLTLNLLLLLVGCNSDSDEMEANISPPISLFFATDVRSEDGEEDPLPEKVNARLHLFGKENEGVIEKEILIDNNGQGNIEHLTEGKWHISYWNIPPEGLYLDKSDNSINVLRTGNYLHEPAPFYAGVSDFDYIPNKPVYLKLKPQTGVLTITLIWDDDVTNLPETISGVLSGIVSKRVFGAQEMDVSEQNIGYAPLLFTPISSSPITYTASRRLLGISNTKKCELVFPNDNISPIKIDLTSKLDKFNNLAANNMLCVIHIYNGMKNEIPIIGVTIEVIDWEERNYESDI